VKNLGSKIKNLVKDKKKLAFVGGGILLVLLVILAIVFFKDKIGGKSQTEIFKANLEELGREFYEDLYYPSTKNGDERARAEFLAGFKDQGLKFNIDNLSRYEYEEEETQKKLDSFKNDGTGEECDKKESKVIIYPEEPYGAKDYRVEIVLVCGFLEE